MKVLPCLCPTCCAAFPKRKAIKAAALKMLKRDGFMSSRSPKETEGRKHG